MKNINIDTCILINRKDTKQRQIHIYTLRSKLRPSPRVSYRTPSGIRPDSRSYTGTTPRLSYPLSQPPPLPPDCTCVCPCSQLCYYCTLRSWMTSLTIRRSHFSVLFLTGKKTSSSRVIHQGLEKNYIYHFMYI